LIPFPFSPVKNRTETSPAHTAGEWLVYNDGRRLEYEILVYPRKDFRDYEHAKRICTVHKFPALDDPHYERLLANARLIAAAPKILEELKLAVGWMEQYKHPSSPSLARAKSVIGKAEGR
jgi:hypothetical protein